MNRELWVYISNLLQVVLFEGWMLGYEPQDNDAVNAVDPQVILLKLVSDISAADLQRYSFQNFISCGCQCHITGRHNYFPTTNLWSIEALEPLKYPLYQPQNRFSSGLATRTEIVETRKY